MDFARNNRGPLPRQQVDSISSLFANYMAAIDSGEQKIRKVPEFDTAFGVVRLNLQFLQHQKMFWSNWVPKFIALYKLGWQNLSDIEKKEMIHSPGLMKESQLTTNKMSDNLLLVNQEFSKKYGFTYVPHSHR